MAGPEVTIATEPTRRTRILLILKEIWGSLLGVDPAEIDIHTHFLEMGADSLLLLQVSTALQNTFGVRIPFRLLLEDFTTVDILATQIDQELPPEESPTSVLPESAPSVSQQQRPRVPGVPVENPSGEEGGQSLQRSRVSDALHANEGPGGADRTSPDTALERVMSQQLRIMSRQLDLLRNKQAGWEALLDSDLERPSFPEESLRLDAPSAPPVLGREADAVSGHGLAAVEAGEQPISVRINPETFVPHKPIKKQLPGGLDPRQQEHLNALIERLSKRTQGSKRLMQTHRSALADNRAVAGFRLAWKEILYPLVSERASGSHIWDVDGNEYLDITMGFGSLLFGHSPPFVVDSLQEQIKKGVQVGLQSPLAGEVAELICELTGMERVAFCNSGTEAVMIALRLARAAVGRSKVALFAGSFHGTFDGILVKGVKSDGDMLRATPLAPGIPEYMAENVIVLEWGNPKSLDILRAHADEVAAVLVEPTQSRRPDVQPRGFLHELGRLTRETGIALIFDEVITGFRVHPGGAQALFGVQADIATYGKVVGGGMPIGIVAGKANYMDAIDGGMWHYGDGSYPRAEMTYIAGTFSKHPLTMAVVWASLNHIKNSGPQLQEELERRTSGLAEQLNTYFERAEVPIRVIHFGSLFRLVYPPQLRFMDVFFYHLLEKGVYVWEGRTCYLSTAHTDEDMDHLIRAVKESIAEMQVGGFLPGRSESSQELFDENRVSDTSVVRTTPLTDAQKQLWALAQLSDKGSRAYNESVTLRLRGSLDLSAMQRALQRVVDRHEALRTTFSPEGSCQRILPRLEINVPLVDFSHLEAGEREERVKEWLAARVQEPFDLARGPLLRCCIGQLEEKHYLLVLTIHHIVIDGWSNGILLRELSMLYSAECRGIACQLGQPVQYREYVQWRLVQEQNADISTAETYWLEQFDGPLPVLNLPADRARPPMQTYNGAHQVLSLDASLCSALKGLGKQLKSTLYMILLAGFEGLLHRLTGQDDIVVGIASAGQMSFGGDRLVGYCVNVLPLRSRTIAPLTFIDYLASVKQTLLNAHANQSYSLKKLIKKLNPSRDPSRPPLVTVVFNVDRSLDEFKFEDLKVDIIPSSAGLSKFDMYMNITETQGQLLLDCEYNTDLFNADTVTRILGHFQTLLEGIVANPQCRLADLPLLTDTEQHQLLIEWNHDLTDYPRDRCIHKLFEAQERQTPDAVAVSLGDRHLTYRELNRRANQLARRLQELEVGPEVLVGVCMDRSVEIIVGLLAVLKAGGAYVPLDPMYPEERLSFMLEDAQVPVLLTQQWLLERLPKHGAQVVCLDTDWDAVARESRANLASNATADNLAYVMYTSGSTGVPKGSSILHRNVVRLVKETNYADLTTEQVFLQFAPISFDASTLEIWGPLLNGGRLAMFPAHIPSLEELGEYLERHGITTLWLTAGLFHLMADEQPASLGRLQQLLAGGDVLSPSHVKRMLKDRGEGFCLINGYGPTENTTFTCCYPMSDVGQVGQTVSIGRPIANTTVYVLDHHMQPVPVGVPGELYTGGDGLARDYLNRPAQTAERFVPNPFSGEPGARLYKTGDMVRYLPDGNIEFIGRYDHQVKIRGFRVELGEIEAVLGRHPAVREVIVLAREAEGDKRLIGYIVTEQGQALTVSELRGFLGEKLPDYMIPSSFLFLETLPLTPNGKVDRQALPTPDETRPELGKDFVAPLTSVEKTLAEIWTQVLDLDRVGINDNFFELGGDSILAIQIIARANQAGLSLSPVDLFQHQTVAELAAVVGTTPAIEADQGAVTGPVPLTPIQRWFFEQDLAEPHHFNMAMLLEMREDFLIPSLEGAVHHLLVHHDALRLRFVRKGPIWQQLNAGLDGAKPFVTKVDLSTLPELEQGPALATAAAELQTCLNPSEGPLMQVALFDLGAHKPGRLLIVIHHLAVDIVSWQILLEDLATAYQQLNRGEEVKLPPKTTSFKHWAECLTEYAQSAALQQELDHWTAERRTRVSRLPVDCPAGGRNTVASARLVSVSLSTEETGFLLQEVPAIYNTQISDVLLTALVRAFAQWTGEHSLLVDLEGHGREAIIEGVDLSRTVGWFTSIFPVLLNLETQGPVETLKSVKEQLRRISNGGIGYGLLRYLCRDAGIAETLMALPQAEVSFNYLGRISPAYLKSHLYAPVQESSGPAFSLKGDRCHLLEITGLVMGDRLQMNWVYSENAHRRPTVEKLAQWFMEELQSLIAYCQSPRAEIYTPSDFPKARLGQEELDKFISRIGGTAGGE